MPPVCSLCLAWHASFIHGPVQCRSSPLARFGAGYAHASGVLPRWIYTTQPKPTTARLGESYSPPRVVWTPRRTSPVMFWAGPFSPPAHALLYHRTVTGMVFFSASSSSPSSRAVSGHRRGLLLRLLLPRMVPASSTSLRWQWKVSIRFLLSPPSVPFPLYALYWFFSI
jgi:hypothetical protein